jgi:L-fuconolactonase
MTAEGFVDAHLHSWDRTRIRYPWLEGDDASPMRFVPADLPPRSAPLAAVFVEVDVAPGAALDEAVWAAALPDHAFAAIVAHAAIETGPVLQRALDDLMAVPRVVGVRRLLQDEPVDRLADPAWAEGLRLVGERGLVFDACVRHHQLPALLRLVRAAPATTVVLDHLGKPPLRAGWGSASAEAWVRAIRLIAAEPSTVVKLSGLTPEAGPGPLEAQMRPYVETAIDAFGTDRAMAGSDWPVSRRPGWEYGDWFALLAEGFGLDRAQRDQVLRSTAARVYRVPEAALTPNDDR